MPNMLYSSVVDMGGLPGLFCHNLKSANHVHHFQDATRSCRMNRKLNGRRQRANTGISRLCGEHGNASACLVKYQTGEHLGAVRQLFEKLNARIFIRLNG
jgi:hypothetical protein